LPANVVDHDDGKFFSVVRRFMALKKVTVIMGPSELTR